MSLTLQAFEEQIFSLQLVKVVRVYDEHRVVENVPERGANDEQLPTMAIRPGPREQRVDTRRNGLQGKVGRPVHLLIEPRKLQQSCTA